MSFRSGLRAGLITGGISIFLILIGITTLVGTMIQGWFKLEGQAAGAWILLLCMAFVAGTTAVKQLESHSWKENLIAGVAAGLSHGILVGVVVAILAALDSTGIELREWLAQLSSEAINLLTLGRPPFTAGAAIFGASFVVAALGAVFQTFRVRRARGRAPSPGLRDKFMSIPTVARTASNPLTQRVLMGTLVVLVLVSPFFLGQYWNYTLGTVGIYVILGLGLNIVVGMAGLLDLGYVAFFAVGAYTMAILTAPEPHNIQMNFWLVLLIGVVIAALSGILLGIPVLRMRGDYLAIVTLGFGEIIRILAKSDVLLEFTGGPRGIRNVGHPTFFGKDIGDEFFFMYIILAGILLVIFVTKRLEGSRLGRGWRAMREDENVAEAMGIHTLKYKLLAFGTGAALAGLGGGIFASRNSFTGPEDFVLLVSINVLALVIVGGMGSIPGVILGALVLKGLPEILRQLEDYRILAFGALLVLMMIVRPQGLWPPSRPQLERASDQEPAVEQS